MSSSTARHERVEKLKNNMIRKDFQTWKEPGKQHQLRWGPKGTDVRMCLERARLITQSYKETEGEPEVIRRAKALAHILTKMTIYINDHELIVGNFASSPSGLPINPELSVEWLEKEMMGQWNDILDEEGHREFKEITDYWRDRCIDGRVKALLPDDLQPWILYRDNGGIVSGDEYQLDRSFPPLDYEKLLNKGLEGIIRETEDRLEALHESNVPVDGIEVGAWIDQVNFLKAVIMDCRAAIHFSERFSILATKMAEKEQDETRKQELLEIAENCKRVPRYPAANLHQACQSWWFAYLIVYLIESTRHGSPCRFDQIMDPFYKKEKEEGTITRGRAQELVECLQMKIEDTGQIALPSFHVVGSGTTLYQKFTIGGVDENGNDASNELSMIVLDAAMETRTCQATVALRYHPGLSKELLYKAIDCIRSGMGYPDIYNDSHVIPLLGDRGVPLKIARDYAIPSCVSVALPKKNIYLRIAQACFLSLGKCLELALNQGKSMPKDRQIGYATPDPLTFTSVDDVIDAYLKQIHFAIDKVAKINNIASDIYRRYGQVPFTSALLDGCIQRGMDSTAWTEYPYHPIVFCGSVNVADSLAALKKLVFEEKSILMEELLEALKANFEGHEELRQRLLNDAPKFGNDDDYVDLIMRDIIHLTKKEVGKSSDLWGHPLTIDGSPAAGYYAAGLATWALPDGKREGRVDTYADGTLSPAAGKDKSGPTAVIKSMGKVDTPCPQTANQKFMPQFLEGENREVFASYLKTWSEMNNYQIQFNVVDRDTLEDAQENPEEHTDLIVRVAGYSAYFVDLPRGVQNDIVERTPQCFS